MRKMSSSLEVSPKMDGSVVKHQRTINEIMGGPGLVTKEVNVEKQDQAMKTVDVTKPVASSGLGPQLVEAMKKE